MTARLESIVSRIGYRDGVSIECEAGGFRVVAVRPDTFTGESGTGRSGLREVTARMSDSQIIRSIFAALMSYEEHEAREAFTLDGKRIFGPHIDVDALAEVSERYSSEVAA